MAKRLINEPNRCVEQNLLGCALRSENVALLDRYPVVIRRDLASLEQVAIVAGGGSGHEPAFAGFVGAGGLSAAVAGNVFASPPTEHVLAALTAARNSTGVLLMVINYTGDRLNFGIAVQRAKSLMPNLKVNMVIFGEDCAVQSTDRSAGRRGLAGSLFLIKICGAMAEAKLPLQAIAQVGQEVAANSGTIGVSLSSCSPPGRGPLFNMPVDQMELGLGIHGEPGVKRVPLTSAKETVNAMLKHMVDTNSATRFKLDTDRPVVILLNNLGCTSQMEMNILCAEALSWLRDRHVTVARVYLGTCMTSLDMHGFSISLLHVCDSAWLDYLDAEHDMAAWPNGTVPTTQDSPLRLALTQDVDLAERALGVQADQALVDKIGNAIVASCDAIVESAETIDKLDSTCGDGDCGSTLKRAALILKSDLNAGNLSLSNPCALFGEISKLFEHNIGGTTGALYALFFSAASNRLAASLEADCWFKAFADGTRAVMQYGQARPGDRTLVDTLWSVNNAMKSLKEKGFSISQECYEAILSSARGAVAATKDMVAYAGRASYVAREYLTEPDAGAYAAYVIIKAILSSL